MKLSAHFFCILFSFLFQIQSISNAYTVAKNYQEVKQEQEYGFEYFIMRTEYSVESYAIKTIDKEVKPDKDGYVKLWEVVLTKEHFEVQRPLKLTGKLKYFDGTEESLYRKIREHMVIENCYIKTLDLKKLAILKDGRPTITEPLNIQHCFIGEISLQTDSIYESLAVDSVVFNSPVYFQDNNIKTFYITNAVFNSTFRWLNNNGRHFNLWNTKFNKTVYLIDECGNEIYTKKREIYAIFYRRLFSRLFFIYNCVANDSVIIHTNNEQKEFDFQSSSFMGPVITSPDNLAMIKKSAFREIDIRKEQVWNLYLDNCKFYNYVDFSNSVFNNCSFKDITFQGPLILSNTSISYKDTANLKRISQKGMKTDFSAVYFMKDNLPLTCDPNFFNLDILGFSPLTIAKASLSFEINNPNGFDQLNLEKMNGFLSRANQYYKETFKDEPLAVEEIVNHNNHLKLENQAKYQKTQSGFSFQLLKYNLLEYLVGNGYNGEVKFFPSVLLFILLFTIIYNIWFVRDVQAYILKINEKSNPNEPVAASKQKKTALSVITLVQCFWMSVIIFLNPRFPAAYFRFRNSFMIVVVIEWLIGLIMIILFLIFIASKYAFVKTLLGI